MQKYVNKLKRQNKMKKKCMKMNSYNSFDSRGKKHSVYEV